MYQQSLQTDGGIAGYSGFSRGRFTHGKSYPETTGYTINTLLDFDSVFKSAAAYEAAMKMAEFELKIQNTDGSFNGGTLDHPFGPSVFNSAQIIDGLLRAYDVSKDKRYLDSALSSCRWISSVQDEEGCWSKQNYLGEKRVYDTKVSQALLKADNITQDNEFSEVVEKNLNWVMANQKENGWFDNCDNTSQLTFAPLTHTIAYTTHGLLECYQIRKNPKWLDAAVRPLKNLSDLFELSGKPVAARYYSDWKPASWSSCITGDSQIAICWWMLYEILNDSRYMHSALKMNTFLKSIQFISEYKEISGAVPSSYPLYGAYHPYVMTNWTIKYFADSLILEYKLKNRGMRE